MPVKYLLFFISFFCGIVPVVYSQSTLRPSISDYYAKWGIELPEKEWAPQFSDSLFIFSNGDNKRLLIVMAPFVPQGYDTVTVIYEHNKQYPVVYVNQSKPLFTVHGNVMYDLYYQSDIDTPYVQKDVYQHTLQTSLEVTYRDQYPFRINFTTRMGNSSLFRDLTDYNLQFTNRDFKNLLLKKADAYEWDKYVQRDKLDKIRLSMEQKQLELSRLKAWRNGPSSLQNLIEAKERAYYGAARDSIARLKSAKAGKLPVYSRHGLGDITLPDSLIHLGERKKETPDSTLRELKGKFAEADKRIDSLQQELVRMQQFYQQELQLTGNKKAAFLNALGKSKNNRELADNLEKENLPDSVLPKGYKQLLAIRSVGIGRTLVNYSELTAKNISILGLQAEYNPSWYVAFATGKVDYRFRDFIYNDNRSKQYLHLVRIGKGMVDGNNIILTWYTGKKQVYNFNGTDSTVSPEQHIMGVSLEGKWQVDANNSITGEIAKSSLPAYARTADDHSSDLGSIFRMNDHSNQAYAIRSSSFIPKTGTKINAMYKVMGANFQSFSLFTTGSSQSAWSVKVDQPFFKQRLMIAAGIKKNDFSTSYQASSYSSNTVFKSIQATLRMRKWPVVSLGYFPSAQLTRLSDGSYFENNFYTLVGTISHSYTYHSLGMNTVLSYTQFYNRQSDSSFVYFNTKNLQLMHTVFFGRLTVNGSGSVATSPEYNLYGADGNIQYKIRKWLEAGGGLKYNYQTTYNIRQIGHTVNCRVIIPQLGEVFLMWEKAFIPGMERKLVSSNNGRITYTKTF